MTRKEALESIVSRARSAAWAGADPYDGLHTSVGRLLIPFGPVARLAVIQSCLRFPRVRALMGPRDSVNPKGLALLLGAISRAAPGRDNARTLAATLRRALAGSAREHKAGVAWGYPFPWQSRFFWAPADTPNAVVTATAGWHLLAAAEAFGDTEAQTLAGGAVEFLINGLHWAEWSGGACAVSYTPRDRTCIVNVSALVARLLARAGDRGRASRLAMFIQAMQQSGGGWPYAPQRRGRWEDSFHTGFILESLLNLRRDGVDIPKTTLVRGFASYMRFFDTDGGARLYASAGSPYDAHSAAQGMVTFAAAADDPDGRSIVGSDPRGVAIRIEEWVLRALWLPKRGHFAYRIRNGRVDEREFARWVQAWMALGFGANERMVESGRSSGRSSGLEVAS